MTSRSRVHFWNLSDAHPLYVCGCSPIQGENDHVIGHIDDREAARRFLAQPAACRRCARAVAAHSSGRTGLTPTTPRSFRGEAASEAHRRRRPSSSKTG